MPVELAGDPVASGLIALIAPGEEDAAAALAAAKEVARRALPGAWVVEPLGAHSRDYLLRRRSGRDLALGCAFDLARELRADREVASADPALTTPGLEPTPALRGKFGGPTRTLAGGGGKPLPCAENDPAWSLKAARITDAWAAHPTRGEGILVGHPDTGYTRHFAIWSNDPAKNRLLIDEGIDYIDDDGDGEDELQTDPGLFPGHGTGTASVIMATEGPVGSRAQSLAGGAAPKAKLVPMRVTRTVILLHYDNLAKALHRAGDEGYHVVSISLGGPVSVDYLERAVDYAISRGVIVHAAAGNRWPFVAWPAHYDQVIAVAASNCEDRIWSASARGDAVDITAPGESVWRARANQPGSADDDVHPGAGTSFAVATTAGACCLWLAHHGRDALIGRYGAKNLAAVFGEVLVNHGYRLPQSGQWDTDKHGVGILDAKALLEAPLPERAPARPFRLFRLPAAEPTGLEDFIALFPGVPPEKVRRGLVRFLDTTEADLGRVLAAHRSEVRLHAAIDPDLRRAIISPSTQTGGRRLAAATPGQVAPLLMSNISRGLAAQISAGD